MTPALIAIAIKEAPAAIALVRSAMAKSGGPIPSDEEIIQAYRAAFESSLAKDAQWLALHPQHDSNGGT